MTFRGLIKKEKQKQTAVCLFACDEENVTFGVLIKNYTVVVKKRFFDATEQNQNKKPTSRCNTIRHATKAYILLKRESAVSGSNRRENCKTEK
jgi:hypothetical protein